MKILVLIKGIVDSSKHSHNNSNLLLFPVLYELRIINDRRLGLKLYSKKTQRLSMNTIATTITII